MFAAPNTRARQFAIAALTVALLVATQNSSWAAAPTPLKKGDRVVLLGDSITAAGVRKTGFITMMREVIDKKHADLKVQLIGAGISGHKVPDCQKRLQRDVINKKPTIVFIYIGINDVWHSFSKRGTSKENFEKGLRRMIERINEAGGRVILCTPSVIGEKIGGTELQPPLTVSVGRPQSGSSSGISEPSHNPPAARMPPEASPVTRMRGA